MSGDIDRWKPTGLHPDWCNCGNCPERPEDTFDTRWEAFFNSHIGESIASPYFMKALIVFIKNEVARELKNDT